MRHINIPIFIPHLGCPHTCVFCNQRKISGVGCVDIGAVREQIDTTLDGIRGREGEYECEIAFFGGSFTGIPRDELTELLELARPYVDDGRVASLRCSTRPDYIDEEIIDLLLRYRMTTVELGVQSTSEEVLRRCERGHTAEQSMAALRMIRESGMHAIGQMMTGLPGSTRESDLQTGRDIIGAGADGARIYPTMTFAGTALEGMLRRGEYTPPSAEETVERVADLCELFSAAGVPVIRIGLCYGEGLTGDDGIVAGDYECAIGEMAQSRVFLRRLRALLADAGIRELGSDAGNTPAPCMTAQCMSASDAAASGAAASDAAASDAVSDAVSGAAASDADASDNNGCADSVRAGADAPTRNERILTVVCPRGRTSQVIGHRRANAEALRREYGIGRLCVREDDSLCDCELRVQS